jgi:hypothetical protein
MKPIRTTLSLLSIFLLWGCASKGPTRLIGDFQSSETAQHVRDRTEIRWHEERKALDPSDHRPHYEFVMMDAPFKDSGIEGHLTLTFYNDRLMEAEFITTKGSEYMAALKKNGQQVPTKWGQGIRFDRSTEFRFYTDPDGSYRFLWIDPTLQAEWYKWVAKHT